MDASFWTTEVNAVLGAPVVFGLAVVTVGVLTWRGVNWAYSRQIDALKDTITSLNERLKLAHDQFAHVTHDNERLQAMVEELQRRIAAQASPEELLTASRHLVSAAADVGRGLDAVGVTISPGPHTGYTFEEWAEKHLKNS